MQGTDKAAEYKIGRAIVRMHGTPDRKNLETAVARFMQQVQNQKKQVKVKGEERP